MNISIGKWYLTRNGRIVRMIANIPDSSGTPWTGVWIPPLWWDAVERFYSYSDAGEYLPGSLSDLDLIKELDDDGPIPQRQRAAVQPQLEMVAYDGYLARVAGGDRLSDRPGSVGLVRASEDDDHMPCYVREPLLELRAYNGHLQVSQVDNLGSDSLA